MARLGEFDTRTTSDGQHLDVYIEKAVGHDDFSLEWLVSDIAMVYLEDDVSFNGMFSK